MNVTFFENVSLVDKLTFTKHLSLMLKSGIALAEAIEILENQTAHFAFKHLLKKLHQEIANGQPLHKALSNFPKVFDKFYISLIRVAEESGNLEKNLDYLATYLKKQYEFSGKVRGALLYPSIVLGVATITGISLSVFVLPKLIDLFKSLDVQLPLSTKILLAFAQLMKDYGILIVGGLITLFVSLRIAITTKLVKPYWSYILLSTPIFGQLIQNIELASFFRNLGTMLQSGLPISQALEASNQTITNPIYKGYVAKLQEGMKKGKTIEDIFSKSGHKFLPLVAIRMIGVGEKTGKLDETFLYLGEFFEDEVDTRTKDLSTILEPIVLIIVGAIVAFIAIAIIGPIYQFTGSIKR